MRRVVSLGCRWALPSLTVLLLVVASGCGGGYTVNGKVQWKDGSPAKELAGGTVQFEWVAPEGETRGTGATSDINPDGTFSLTAKQAGKYRVAVIPKVTLGEGKMNPSPLPEKYQQTETSGIEVNVEPKTNDNVVITVEKGPPPRQ